MSYTGKAIIDAETGNVLGHYPQRYRCKLNTMREVQNEMAKVYREARSGVIPSQEGTKLVWILQAVGRVIEGSALEERVEALENIGNVTKTKIE